MDRKTVLLEQAETLVSRLERLSADSVWAHRVSGYRGALLRIIDKIEGRNCAANLAKINETAELSYLADLLEYGYVLLEKAARELIT